MSKTTRPDPKNVDALLVEDSVVVPPWQTRRVTLSPSEHVTIAYLDVVPDDDLPLGDRLIVLRVMTGRTIVLDDTCEETPIRPAGQLDSKLLCGINIFAGSTSVSLDVCNPTDQPRRLTARLHGTALRVPDGTATKVYA